MKLCLLNDSFPPTIDGVANAVVNYADVLSAHGDEVVVATPQYPGAVDAYPYTVFRYPSLSTEKIFGYRAGNPFAATAIKALSDFNPDLLHCHCPVMSQLLARLLRESCDSPLVMTYHTKFDIDIKNAIKSKLVQESTIQLLVDNISASDEVWCVSHGAGENLKSLGYKGEYLVMENGVDFERGTAPDAMVRELRAKHGVSRDETVFLFVGRLMWYKGIRLILAGLDGARRQGAEFRMFFVGDGADRGEIEAYTSELGLKERCVFTGAIHDRELLRGYFTLANLFLFPSTFDTNGIVVREAAACGLGALLIEGSCAAEGVVNARNGIVIPESVEAMTEQLVRGTQEKRRLSAIGGRARDELYISWKQSVETARLRYEELAKQPRTKRHSSFTDDMISAYMRPYVEWVKTRNLMVELEQETKRRWNELLSKTDRYL